MRPGAATPPPARGRRGSRRRTSRSGGAHPLHPPERRQRPRLRLGDRRQRRVVGDDVRRHRLVRARPRSATRGGPRTAGRPGRRRPGASVPRARPAARAAPGSVTRAPGVAAGRAGSGSAGGVTPGRAVSRRSAHDSARCVRARVRPTYSRRRSSARPSSSSIAWRIGSPPSSRAGRNTASHSSPFARWRVSRLTPSAEPVRSWAARASRSASTAGQLDVRVAAGEPVDDREQRVERSPAAPGPRHPRRRRPPARTRARPSSARGWRRGAGSRARRSPAGAEGGDRRRAPPAGRRSAARARRTRCRPASAPPRSARAARSMRTSTAISDGAIALARAAPGSRRPAPRAPRSADA